MHISCPSSYSLVLCVFNFGMLVITDVKSAMIDKLFDITVTQTGFSATVKASVATVDIH